MLKQFKENKDNHKARRHPYAAKLHILNIKNKIFQEKVISLQKNKCLYIIYVVQFDIISPLFPYNLHFILGDTWQIQKSFFIKSGSIPSILLSK